MPPTLLLTGLPAHLGSWLADRLPGWLIEVAFSLDEVEEAVAEGRCSAVVVAEGPDEAVDPLLARLGRRGAPVPLFLVIDPGPRGMDVDLLSRRLGHAAVREVLFHPLDRGELLRHLRSLAGLAQVETEPGPGAPAPAADPVRERMTSAMGTLWTRARSTVLERVATVERAARAAVGGTLGADGRRQAEMEAHRLAGSLGTFGLAAGSTLARELERAFGGGGYLGGPQAAPLEAAAARLRRAVEQHTPEQAAARAPVSPPPAGEPTSAPARTGVEEARWRVGVLGGAPLLEAVRGALAGLDARAEPVAAGGGGAAPAALVADLTGPADPEQEWRTLLECSERFPGVPLVAVSDRGTLLDRVRAIQLGVRSFLYPPLDAETVRQALLPVLPAGETGSRRVFAVDDDPVILDVLRSLLEAQGLEVHTAGDPLDFWRRLPEVSPQLAILDVDMPRLNGVELCRVLRTDARWRRLPILFLTARTDRETALRIFAAGADDYVTKPILGAELLARIRNRMERAGG